MLNVLTITIKLAASLYPQSSISKNAPLINPVHMAGSK